MLFSQFYCHSLGDFGSSKLYLSVYHTLTAYISIIMSWILLKLCGSVGTWVPSIVLKFHKNQFSDVVIPDFLGFFAKGENFVAKGNLTTSVYPI